jgi:iron complex outermembrane receptor protein
MKFKSLYINRSIGLITVTTSISIAQETSKPDGNAVMLDEIVVTANPLVQTLFEQVQPASILDGDDLLLDMQPTLGETLKQQPGVSSTYFGPGASRPIIRGLGDDRVRILQNGTSMLDVSNVSPDHASSADPLSVSAIEVVRGPATLLYGPNSIGGVVNVIDERIPQERFTGTYPSGKVATSVGSVNDLFNQSGAVTWGAGNIVFHLDAFHSESGDLEIPGYARSAPLRKSDPVSPEPRGTLPNSATESTGGGVGASYVWDGGYLGFSYSGLDSDYGTVAEPDVTIDLRQRRWDMRGAVFSPLPGIKEINYKFGYSNYDHTEFEGCDVGTRFEIDGYNGRIELLHEKTGPFEGALGFESQYSEFSALGDEAFLPPVDNQVNSAFFFEEIPLDAVRLQFGARYDYQTSDSRTHASFGPGIARDFNAFSVSAGVVYNPTDDYAVTLSTAYTQRPPTYVELFADGPHVATGTFEAGDPDLGTEDSLSLDLSLRKRAGRVTGSISGFYYRFNDFINLAPTGNFDLVDALPIYDYSPIGATFYGGEIETTFHLLEPAVAPPVTDSKNILSVTPAVSRQLDLTLGADYVHAEDRSTGEPIPRIPPFRLRAALDFTQGAFGAGLEGVYAAAQDRHADDELPTDGYFLLNASVSYNFDLGGLNTYVYLKGANLTNETARESTSFLKDIAPLPGRGVVVGLRTEF